MPPNICFDRIQNRRRIGEFNLLMKEYLQLLDRLYEKWAYNDFTPLHKGKYIELDRRLPTSILVDTLCEILATDETKKETY